MYDSYVGELNRIENALRQEMSILNEGDDKLAAFMARHLGDEMSLNGYLKLLEMVYARCMKSEEHEKERKYIVMRMQSAVECRNKKWLRRNYPHMTGFDDELDEGMISFIERKRPYWKEYKDASFKRLIWVAVVLYVCTLLLMVYGLNMSFGASLLICLVLLAALLVYFRFFLTDKLAQERLGQLSKSLDDDLRVYEQDFVAPVKS